MNSLLSRGNALVAFTLSILACLTFLCFLSTVFVDYGSNATINTVKAVVKNMPDYSASREKCDLGLLSFDLQSNLTNVFNWNVKQLFLYLTAEYSSQKNALSQVVLWDKIILRGENAILDFKSMNSKYYVWDDGNGIKNNSHIALTLSYNIIPNSGFLPNIASEGHHVFRFPSEYTASRV